MWAFINDCISKNENSILFDKDNKILYNELLKIVEKTGDIFKKILPSKSKCAILCDKGLNTAITILSCWYADLIPIPMSKNYGEKHCENIINLINPDIIIYDKKILISFSGMWFNIITNEIINNQIVTKVEDILNDVAIIMCTSGTTGMPKGAMITKQGLIKNVENIAAYFDIKKDDTIIIARPIYHCAVLTGEFLVSLYKGLNIGFFDESYNPVSLINFINENKITVLCGTPTLFNHISMCLSRTDYENNIKTIAISGECLSKKVAKNIRFPFPNVNIYNIYGLTEAAPRVSYLPPEYFDEYPESVGIPLNDNFIKIVDIENNGKELQNNMHGKIMIKSPSIMKGYYNNEILTKSVLIDGWLDSGDIGYKDENGFLYIVSRVDDMIIKAGMNIYPKEIEDIINEIDIIDGSIVYGICDGNGQNIAIDLVLNKKIDNIGIKELMKIFADVLPSYQIPTNVNIIDKIERNASGKIIRRRAIK